MKRKRESTSTEVTELPEDRMEKILNCTEQMVTGQAQMLKCMIETQTQLVDRVNGFLGRQSQGSVPRYKMVRLFLKLGAPKFHGGSDHVLADRWLVELEKIFDVTECTDEQKVMLATYLLEDNAYHWWAMTERSMNADEIDWQKFRKLFLDRYFPEFVRHQYFNELLHLTQGNMSLHQYESRFNLLCHYAKYQNYVDTDEERARRFQHGLKYSIRIKLVAMRLKTYADVLATARIVEDMQQLMRDEQQQLRVQVQAPQYNEQQNFQPRGPQQPGQGNGVGGGCYVCGSLGHTTRFCPINPGRGNVINMQNNDELSDDRLEDDEVESH